MSFFLAFIYLSICKCICTSQSKLQLLILPWSGFLSLTRSVSYKAVLHLYSAGNGLKSRTVMISIRHSILKNFDQVNIPSKDVLNSALEKSSASLCCDKDYLCGLRANMNYGGHNNEVNLRAKNV